MSKTVMGVMMGTRDFFPAEPVRKNRQLILDILAGAEVEPVILDEGATNLGAIETWEDAKKCAALFKSQRDRIEGIVVFLPVFAPEKAVADSIHLSGLKVPVLVQAFPDDLDKLGLETRGDAFCGKISACNNLYQYGIPFTLTQKHTVHPSSERFKQDLAKFISVCKVVNGLRKARLGAIGARPSIFNTVRFSEKLLQSYGITVNTVDLSEIFGVAGKLADDDPKVKARLEGIRSYIKTDGVPNQSMYRMAKMGVAIDEWCAENEVNATAIECWTSIQKNYGVNACTLMSMMSHSLMPSACEVDITGALSMYALQLASGTPSALVDWNNNYGDESDKCVLFHCGNWPKSFFGEIQMSHAEILATVLGVNNTYGTVSAQALPSPLTFARISTDDRQGKIKTYVGEGKITNDVLKTFGSRAVAEIPDLQRLLAYICKNGYEHHAAMNASLVADVIEEAFGTYLGWEVYRHR